MHGIFAVRSPSFSSGSFNEYPVIPDTDKVKINTETIKYFMILHSFLSDERALQISCSCSEFKDILPEGANLARSETAKERLGIVGPGNFHNRGLYF